MTDFDSPEWLRAADTAIETGALVSFAVRGQRYIAMPDVVALAGLANGHETPDTASVTRNDGRKVYFFDGDEEI